MKGSQNLRRLSIESWMIILDLNELTSSRKRISNNTGNSTRYDKFNKLLGEKMALWTLVFFIYHTPGLIIILI